MHAERPVQGLLGVRPRGLARQPRRCVTRGFVEQRIGRFEVRNDTARRSGSRIGASSAPTQAPRRDSWISLRLLRHQLGEDTPQAQCLLTEVGAYPVLARTCRIALVED